MKIRITDTTLRDAHQSLWATRMRTKDILGIIDRIDAAGYYSLECWGGATFDVCLRFLREDPWERLRLIKSHTKRPLQMLLRGQNILGYKHYPDDILERFIELSARAGISIFRIFDALNDVRNLESAIKCVKRVGAHAQGTISYTVSPVHTHKMYARLAHEMEQLGADSICVKDMAGILTPGDAASLVAALKNEVKIPIQLHSHMTSGMAVSMYLEGVKAGAEALDCCIPSMSGISSQPPVETMRTILNSCGYETELDSDALAEIDAYFRELAPSREGPRPQRAFVDSGVLKHHIPGGMISNLRSQLLGQGALDRLPEVLDELPRVRAEMGYPPLVTPTSQIIGVQAVMNVLSGVRYAMVTDETRKYVRGLYGRPPAELDEAIEKKILSGEEKINCRPADLLSPGLATAAKMIPAGLIQKEEDILSYCLFPDVAMGYFEWRKLPQDKRPPIPADLEMKSTPQREVVTEKSQEVPNVVTDENKILSPLSGTFLLRPAPGKEPYSKEGAFVKAGDTIAAIEAMKLLNPILAKRDLRIVRFLHANGDNVAKGEPIIEVE